MLTLAPHDLVPLTRSCGDIKARDLNGCLRPYALIQVCDSIDRGQDGQEHTRCFTVPYRRI
jgi:hypothetical protein